MQIVILDGHTVNPGDLSWDALKALGDLTVYEASSPEELLERTGSSAILITSKCLITKEFMKQCPDLKYIGSMATGYNNIDVAAAKELGIAVTNIPAYSTDAVAQHTFALILELSNHTALHDRSVKNGDWSKCDHFCYWKQPITLLSGRSLGIIGYGRIGKKVGEIASAFGMKVNVYSRDKEAAVKSDFLTLHCPLTEENAGFVNEEFISKMKPGSILINTARGGLLDEHAVARALETGHLRAAALDVLSQEPPKESNPLLHAKNCIITPHIAWAPKEMRRIICETLAENLKSFLEGGTLNRVDL